MGFLGQLFFGKKEREAILVHIPYRLVSGMDTLVYVHNSNTNEMDHISYDDIVEAGVEHIVREALRIKPQIVEPKEIQKPKRQNATPAFYVEDHVSTSRGRNQSR
jgi:hypothetical protein